MKNEKSVKKEQQEEKSILAGIKPLPALEIYGAPGYCPFKASIASSRLNWSFCRILPRKAP